MTIAQTVAWFRARLFNESEVSTPRGVRLHDCGDPKCDGFERGYKRGWNAHARAFEREFGGGE